MPTSSDQEIHYKSGAAARIANIPVTTLRVWERRYQVVAPPKTGSGQRLYRAEDVHRLVLLKGLVDSGHAIGTIAGLPTRQLETLASTLRLETAPAAPAAQPAGELLLGVIGQGLLARVDAWLLRRPKGAQRVALCCRHADLAQAAQAGAPAPAIDLLAVQINSLRQEDAAAILTLMQGWHCKRVVVLYGFGTREAVQSLRACGVAARQGPLIGLDLESLIEATLPAPAMPLEARAAVPPPRYSSQTLEAVAELKTSVACECPRHVVNILGQLMAFERYSADCLTGNADDVALHMELSRTAGVARELFERALHALATSHGFTDALEAA